MSSRTECLVGPAIELALLPVTLATWACCSAALALANKMMGRNDDPSEET